jgi:hypothetical protein
MNVILDVEYIWRQMNAFSWRCRIYLYVHKKNLQVFSFLSVLQWSKKITVCVFLVYVPNYL